MSKYQLLYNTRGNEVEYEIRAEFDTFSKIFHYLKEMKYFFEYDINDLKQDFIDTIINEGNYNQTLAEYYDKTCLEKRYIFTEGDIDCSLANYNEENVTFLFNDAFNGCIPIDKNEYNLLINYATYTEEEEIRLIMLLNNTILKDYSNKIVKMVEC